MPMATRAGCSTPTRTWSRWPATRAELDEAALESALGELLRRYDKSGDQFYDAISALHKSVRGSDPDAALYWLARMLDGGVDPRYVARRVLRMASEDIGLADPRALQLALAAADVYERLGSPEGELALAAGGGLPRRGAEVERGLQGLERGARAGPARRHAAGAGSPAQCADAADEGPRPRPGLPLRARRAGRLRRRRELLARRAGAAALLPAGAARAGAAHRASGWPELRARDADARQRRGRPGPQAEGTPTAAGNGGATMRPPDSSPEAGFF